MFFKEVQKGRWYVTLSHFFSSTAGIFLHFFFFFYEGFCCTGEHHSFGSWTKWSPSDQMVQHLLSIFHAVIYHWKLYWMIHMVLVKVCKFSYNCFWTTCMWIWILLHQLGFVYRLFVRIIIFHVHTDQMNRSVSAVCGMTVCKCDRSRMNFQISESEFFSSNFRENKYVIQEKVDCISLYLLKRSNLTYSDQACRETKVTWPILTNSVVRKRPNTFWPILWRERVMSPDPFWPILWRERVMSPDPFWPILWREWCHLTHSSQFCGERVMSPDPF